MHVRVWRTVASAAIGLIGSMILAGCGDSGSVSNTPPSAGSPSSPASGASAPATPDADVSARAVIDSYLNAMKAKDVRKGREQMCAAVQVGFDERATSPNGDFADHFVLTEANIDRVESAGTDRKVTAKVTVAPKSGGSSNTASVLFTVTAEDSRWCISNATLAP